MRGGGGPHPTSEWVCRLAVVFACRRAGHALAGAFKAAPLARHPHSPPDGSVDLLPARSPLRAVGGAGRPGLRQEWVLSFCFFKFSTLPPQFPRLWFSFPNFGFGNFPASYRGTLWVLMQIGCLRRPQYPVCCWEGALCATADRIIGPVVKLCQSDLIFVVWPSGNVSIRAKHCSMLAAVFVSTFARAVYQK